LTFPATPLDGDQLVVSTTHTISTLTLTPGSGTTLANPVTTLTAGSVLRYVYDAANTVWYNV
jgi:hypothetical protein